MTRKAALPALVLALVLAAACGGAAAPAPSSSPSPSSTAPRPAPAAALRVGHLAWVSVSVATLWRSPSSPRAVDAPALGRPVRIERWLGAMTLTERRALNGRADTQALLGDRVRVVDLRPGWAKVVVPDQPTPLDARGYPGWVPRRQLTAVRPVRTPRVATVVERTPWLRTGDSAARPLFRVSFGTRFPLAAAGHRYVRVHLPTGGVRRIARASVALHDRGTPALPTSRTDLLVSATSFAGLDYLWAGASGFGVDCSGLTWLSYRVHDVRIPRDASAQWAAGTPVAHPRVGDLLFFGDPVHHVGLYAGRGSMVHAPGTGQQVQMAPAARDDFAGARRLLP
ncbi:C40 family peptidase [Nocardioides aquiterrae]|uniref:C40 family peptidase n=1 Tax=Nocardioides aquiterrae TaxID=203799 RepID=A0ABN1UGW8_9ACTN